MPSSVDTIRRDISAVTSSDRNCSARNRVSFLLWEKKRIFIFFCQDNVDSSDEGDVLASLRKSDAFDQISYFSVQTTCFCCCALAAGLLHAVFWFVHDSAIVETKLMTRVQETIIEPRKICGRTLSDLFCSSLSWQHLSASLRLYRVNIIDQKYRVVNSGLRLVVGFLARSRSVAFALFEMRAFAGQYY